MKKVLALALALIMLISLVPATFAAPSSDIVFDFGAWYDAHPDVARHTEMTAEDMENIAPNKSTSAQTTGFLWETNTNPKTIRLANIRPDWETEARSGGNGSNNKIAFDITVATDAEGWYSLELPFTANNAADVLSIYKVSGGEATYLGDTTATASKTNAVYLDAGVNTLVLCCVDANGQGTTTVYLKKIIFTPLASAPTGAVATEAPSKLASGGVVENLTATLAMSDGTTYQFAEYAMDATTLKSAGADNGNYIKVEAEDEDILSVTYTMTDKKTATYSVEALADGETDLIFTPVIGGAEKSEYATRKTVKVESVRPSAIALSSSKKSVVIGKTAKLSAKITWTDGSENNLDVSKLTFASSNDAIATVATDGTITAVSEGAVTITATYKDDTSKTATVAINVIAEAPARTYEFVTSQAGFNADKMITTDDFNGKPVIRAANNAMYYTQMFDWNYEVPAEYSKNSTAFMALDTTDEDGDAKLTDKWSLVKNYGPLGNIHITRTTMQQQFVPEYYEAAGRTNYVALRLEIDAPGEYILQARAGNNTNGAAPAVYFFKEDTEGVAAATPATYPAEARLGYFNMAATKNYAFVGNVAVDEPGEYILAFVADATSMTINGTTATEPGSGKEIQWFDLSGVKLVPAGDNVLESFTASAEKSEIQVGSTTTVSVKATWTVMGECEVDASEVTFESSDTAIATVDENGVVTGIAKGSATITATYKADTSKTATVNIKVITPGDVRVFEYITSQKGMNVDKMITTDDYSGKPVIRAANNALYFTDMFTWTYEVPGEFSKDALPFMALDTTDEDGDAALTDRWALAANKGGSHLGAIHVTESGIQQQFQISNFAEGGARTNFAAIRLNIDAPGEYLLQAKAGIYPSGVVTMAYFFPEGTEGVEIGKPATYPADAKLIYFNSAKAKDYTFLGNVTVDTMGDYILAFVADENSASMNKVTLTTSGYDYQWFNLAGVRLVPAADDYQTGLSIKADTDILYNGETMPLTVKETWEYAGEKEIAYEDLTFESSDESVATVDANGVVTAISQGKTTITATMKASPEVSGEFKFEIYDPNAENIGTNLIYNIGTGSMKDKTTYNPHNNHLEQSTGRLRDPSDVDSYDEIDETVTELWAYNNYANITWRAFEMDSALLSPSPSDYPKGSFYAFKLRVPVKGTYDLNIETYPFTVGCEADVYLLPKGDMENITLNDVADIEPIGTVTSRDFENRTQTAGVVDIERGGEYFFLLKFHSDNKYLTNTGRHYFSLRKIIFKAATGPFDHVDMAIETLDEEGDELYFNAYRKISYTLRDEYGNEIDGFNPDLVEINDVYLTKGEDVAKIAYENGNYYVETWDAAGEAEVALDLTYRGKNVVETFAFSVADIGKSGRTLYSDEMIAAARENISKYTWARDQKKAAVTKADKYLANGYDFLWYSVTGNGVPRTYHVGIEGDGYEYVCRYCRKDLYALGYGNYPFNVDPLKNPWKITCPECSRSFPSNDFESFYQLGITQENGAQFDRITALEAHRALLIEKNLLSEEAIAMEGPGEDCSDEWYLYYGYGVEGGYLHNDLYAEVGSEGCPVLFDSSIETVERWGVDDSMGYNTGKKFPNGIEEIHTYVGFYNHFAHFYIKNETLYLNALNAFREAYFFTGEKKYGIAGAILTDRLADIYPTYDLNIYLPRFTNINGGSIAGKAVGKIWECYVAEYLANSYDAFWPMFEDPEVIEYLNTKAVYYGMENDKSTATKIRQNIEDGICREIYEATLTSQLNGNFGLNQLAVGNAAIALDHKKDTAEMIAWLYKSSWSNSMTYNTGGEISERLVDVVYRDGQNYESPSYNNLGVTDFIKVAESLARYKQNGGEINEIPILEHPKYLKLINSFQTLTQIRRGVKAIADSGQPAYYNKFPDKVPLTTAFYYTKDSEIPEVREEAVKMAQHLYMQQGESGLKNHHYDIYTRNPEALYYEVMDIIEEYGEYPYDKSSIMTGYGVGFLRDGTLFDTVGLSGVRDTTRDFYLNFSGHSNHQHNDYLDLGMEAYGLGMTMDLGYPETALAGDPHTAQWSQTVLSHNTVMVDESQHIRPSRTSNPSLHFDAKDTRVKVLDAEIENNAYSQCDEFRRTIVMVDFDDEISYGVDFFRVSGGKDHLYTFSPNSNNRPEKSENLTFVKQVDEPQDDWIYDDNHYPFSSYAGPDVQFGWDPYTDMSKVEAPKKFPLGYTWMFNVERCDNPGENEFWLDYEIEDFGKDPSRNANLDIRLRITMLNDFDADEVSLVSHKPQRVAANECVGDLEKFLVRRKGERLDSLFTAVYEPYKAGDRYVSDIQSETLTVSKIAGEGTDKDAVKAVKVVLNDDRTDYIVYASNKNNTYLITDPATGYSFEFSGFVGVWTVNAAGENIYSYIHDGTTLGDGESKIENAEDVVTGTVVDFQKELSLDNWIDVTFNRDFTEEEAEDLVDRMMNIERETPGNSSYVIEGITMTDARNARINLNSTSLISKYKDSMDFSKGYDYNIEEGQTFEIPMSYEMSGNPVFDEVGNKTVSVGSMLNVTVNATPILEDLTVSYRARTLPRGATFDEATATFSWKPSTTQLGKNLVAIDAIDSAGRTSTIYFEVEVLGSTGGGGGTTLPPKEDEPKEDPKEEEPTVEPDEPTTEPDTPAVDVPTETKGFVDLGNHAWAEESINYLASEGIIKGTSETTFAPASNITRADYALLLVRAFKLSSENEENFADVSASDYFAKELAIARNTGLVGGIGDNKYAPKSTITRQDMMVILYRAMTKLGVELKAVEGVDATAYADYADVADYAKEAVKALVNAGLVNGKSGKIAGSEKTTRAEVAVLLKRVLDYIA